MKPHFRIRKETLSLPEEARAWELVLTSIFDGPSVSEEKLLAAMTPGQRILYRLNELHGEVLNGGIHQYLHNSSGDHAEEAIAALRLIRAQPYVELLEKVIAKFPNSSVPKVRSERQNLLVSIAEEQTQELFDNPYYDLQNDDRRKLDVYIETFVRGNSEDFFLREGEPEPVDPDRDPTQWLADYRISRRVVGDATGHELRKRLIEGTLWNHLRGSRDMKRCEDFLGRLTSGQRALVAVELFHDDVPMGAGLCHDIIRCGDLLGDLLAAYLLVGAQAYHDLLERILSTLPATARSKQFKDRYDAFRMAVTPYEKQSAVDELFKTETQRFATNPDSNLIRLVDRYISAQPAEFFKD